MSTIAAVLALVLALVSLVAGVNKFTGTRLAAEAPGHLGIPVGQYRLAGVLEMLAAVGLLLAVLDVVPAALGAAAAFGLALLMAIAVGYHLRAGDRMAPSPPADPGWLPAAIVLVLSALTGVLVLG